MLPVPGLAACLGRATLAAVSVLPLLLRQPGCPGPVGSSEGRGCWSVLPCTLALPTDAGLIPDGRHKQRLLNSTSFLEVS